LTKTTTSSTQPEDGHRGCTVIVAACTTVGRRVSTSSVGDDVTSSQSVSASVLLLVCADLLQRDGGGCSTCCACATRDALGARKRVVLVWRQLFAFAHAALHHFGRLSACGNHLDRRRGSSASVASRRLASASGWYYCVWCILHSARGAGILRGSPPAPSRPLCGACSKGSGDAVVCS
jgi:hypothetical protein